MASDAAPPSELFCLATCVQCEEPESSLRMPHSLSCGHVLCAECASAITLVPLPACTICQAPIEPASQPMPAFADFLQRRLAPEDLPLQRRLTPEDAKLRAKETQFLGAAAVVTAAIESLGDKTTALQDSADAAVDKVVAAVEQIKAKLDVLAAARVAHIRRCCKDGLKKLEAQHDELLVRQDQLRAAASWCASAVGKDRAAQVLASLAPFDTLAGKPIAKLHPEITVRAVSAFFVALARPLLSVFTMPFLG